MELHFYDKNHNLLQIVPVPDEQPVEPNGVTSVTKLVRKDDGTTVRVQCRPLPRGWYMVPPQGGGGINGMRWLVCGPNGRVMLAVDATAAIDLPKMLAAFEATNEPMR